VGDAAVTLADAHQVYVVVHHDRAVVLDFQGGAQRETVPARHDRR
jgi:hypothetical protein